MGLKDFNVSKIRSWKYSDVGAKQRPQRFKDGHSGTIVSGKISGIHGGTSEGGVQGAQPPHQVYHSNLDNNVGELGSPQHANVKAGPQGTIPFPTPYDPRSGGIHGGTEPLSQPPHPDDHSNLDDNVGELGSPQSFTNNGFTVTGERDMISTNFVDEGNIFLAGLTLLEPSVIETPLNPLTRQQIYTVTNVAGEYQITGLKGGMSDDDAILRSQSLIYKTYAELVEGDGISGWAWPPNNDRTMGHRQLPLVIDGSDVIDGIGFGDKDVNSSTAAERYGQEDPTVGFTVGRERGGRSILNIVARYTGYVMENSFYQRFLIKQADLQLNQIMKGRSTFTKHIEAGFNSFAAFTFPLNFQPGVRTYRAAGLLDVLDPPTYLNSRPEPPNGGWIKTDGLDSDFDPGVHPKILWLYNNQILKNLPAWVSPVPKGVDTASAFGGWLQGKLTKWLQDATDPYPIVPKKNVVHPTDASWKMKDSKFDGGTNKYGWHEKSKKWILYLGPESDAKPGVEAGLFNQYRQGSEFSQGQFGNEAGLYDTMKMNAPDKFRSLKDKMGLNIEKPPQDIKDTKFVPVSVGGKPVPDDNVVLDPEKSHVSKLMKTGEDNDPINRNTKGLAKKYSTLSYKALGLKDKGDSLDPGASKDGALSYENTLRSPSEINQTLVGTHGGLGGDRSSPLEHLAGEIEYNYDEDGTRGSIKKTSLGIRDKFKENKVYAIGRQGLVAANVTETVDTALGLIKVDEVDGKYTTVLTDKVNMIPYGTYSDKAGFDTPAEDIDFVPLNFHDVYNEKNITFRSILGDITDTITPEWIEQGFIGRPNKSAAYTGVDRKISFGFQIFPKTKQEFPILLEKVNYLVGLCYPNLDMNYRQSGPLCRLTIGDILRKQLGYITSCTITFPEDSPWEIQPGLRFTKRIAVELEFQYIGNNIPVAQGKHYGLSWLQGSKYNEKGVKFNNFPGRSYGGDPEDHQGGLKMSADKGDDKASYDLSYVGEIFKNLGSPAGGAHGTWNQVDGE